jgi:predicted negative regulator of RcsB-dependent stress response
MLPVASNAAASVANSSYLVIYAVIGVVTLVGFGFAAFKAIRKQGADAERLENRLQSIERNLKPNGLDTEQVGDVVKRTENAVGDLTSTVEELSAKLERHLGASDEAHANLRAAINRKQDKRGAE